MVIQIVSLRTHEQNRSQFIRSFDRLCVKEDQHWKPRIFNQTKSDEVNCHQRNSASIWLRKTSTSMHFSLETYALSVELLDRFLATLKVRPKFLECLVVGCLYLASKCKEEDEKISITPEFVIDCDSKCSSNELLRMEKLILDKFHWFIDFVTPIDFLQLYFALIVKKIENSDEKFLLNRYIELEIQMASCLQHHQLSTYKPRILSLALISLEFERQQSEWNIDWLSSIVDLQRLAKIDNEDFVQCRDLIVRSLSTYKAIRLELSDLKFHSHLISRDDDVENHRRTYADVLRGNE